MQKLFSLTKKLISFETTADKSIEIKKCLNFIKNYLPKNNFFIDYTYKNSPSLVIQNKKTLTSDIIFSGHLDVVPAEKNQFNPREITNKIYGRGAMDMKGNVAAMILAYKKISLQKNAPAISLLLTSDEERGGFFGTGYLVNKIGYRAKIAFVPDGGNDFEIVTEEKGVLCLKITTKGKTAHSATLWQGKNAIENAYHVYKKLTQKFGQPKSTNNWLTSFNLAKIETTNSYNQVPGEAIMDINVRRIKKDSKKQIIDFIKKQPSVKKVELYAEGEHFYINKNNSYVKLYSNILRGIRKKTTIYKKYAASCDARFFSNKNISAIICQPTSANLHGKNEWVDKKALVKYYQSLVEFGEKYNSLDRKNKV